MVYTDSLCEKHKAARYIENDHSVSMWMLGYLCKDIISHMASIIKMFHLLIVTVHYSVDFWYTDYHFINMITMKYVYMYIPF